MQHTREIAVRLALGSSESGVVKLMMRQESMPVVIGLGVGLAASVSVGIVIQGFLLGVSPFDPISYLTIGPLLTAAAFLAMYVPARRAAPVDPSMPSAINLCRDTARCRRACRILPGMRLGLMAILVGAGRGTLPGNADVTNGFPLYHSSASMEQIRVTCVPRAPISPRPPGRDESDRTLHPGCASSRRHRIA